MQQPSAQMKEMRKRGRPRSWKNQVDERMKSRDIANDGWKFGKNSTWDERDSDNCTKLAIG